MVLRLTGRGGPAGGQSTEVMFALLTQQPLGLILGSPKIFIILDVAKIY